MWTIRAGLLEGESVGYYPSGSVMVEEVYVNSKLNGIVRRYYTDGTLAMEDTYASGVRVARTVAEVVSP